MHSNNTQVQVQIPAYYALGGVAMSSSMGFSGGGSTIESDHSEHIGGPLHPYHLQQNTSPHHPSHHAPAHGPNHANNTYNSPITSNNSNNNNNNNNHTNTNNNSNNNSSNNNNSNYHYQNELKAFPHQIDIYQPPPQTHEQDLLNPLMHRHLNNHASNYHAPYHYHHHHNNHHNNHYTSKHQQQQQQQQQHSNASTPTPTVASTMSVSTASTPSLSSPHPSTMSDYSYGVTPTTPGTNANRHSPPTTPSFHIPSSPDQLVVPQALPNWTTASEPSHHSPREYMKNDRTSPSYYQYGVSEDVQDILDDRDKSLGLANNPVYENESDRRSPRNSGMVRMTDFAVPSQTPTALGALPLLSPSNMIQSDYHQASLGLDAPTIMSHMEYNNNTNRYSTGGPTRTPKRNSSGRTTPNHRDSYSSRTRASSLNSTTSSVASSGILTSLANTMSSTMLSSPTSMDQPYEPEDPASPTSMPRPRPPAAPRKALAARVFSCSVPGCTKSYTQLHNLKSHERTGHTPVIKLKPFHCIIEGCPKAYSQRKSLAIHIKSAHEDFKFKPFKCLQPGCDKAYTQLHNLRTHEKTVHLLDLSRKRTKNTSSTSSSSSSSMSHMMPHHHQSSMDLRYNHLEDLAALGLEIDDDAQGEEEDHDEYARQQHHHQDHHNNMHHHSYSRAFPSMHHHHHMNPNTNAMMGPLPGQHRV